MEENIRSPDSSYTDRLVHNFDDTYDDEMRQILKESLTSYNEEIIKKNCDEIFESNIQEIIQREFDELKEKKQKKLKPVIIRLLRIDPEKKYLNIINSYINNIIPIHKNQYDELIAFIQKPELITIIQDNIDYK